MSESRGVQEASTLVLRISVPAGSGYRAIVEDLAVRVAAYVGDTEPEARTAMALLEDLARTVAPADTGGREHDLTVEFHQIGGALLMQASCDGRSADARHPLASASGR